MRDPLRQIVRSALPRAAAVLAVVLWAAVAWAQATGRLSFKHADFAVWTAPLLVIAAASASRRPLPRLVWRVLWACLTVSAATAAIKLVLPHTLVVAAIPVALGAAVICTRWPVAALLAMFVVASTFGSLQAFTPISPSKTVEVLLAGMWLGVAWRCFVSGRRPKVAIVPGIVVLTAFAALELGQALGAASLTTGFRTFVSTGFYMSSVGLVGLLGLDAHQLRRLGRGIVVIAVGVAAYAMLRHAIGPASKEVKLAYLQPYNFKGDKLLLIGSFLSRHQIGQWAALLAAFCAGYATILRGTWRVACFAVVLMAALACIWSESRSALVAGAVGVLAALVLLHASRGFPGPRLGAVFIAVAAIALGTVGAVAMSGSDSAQTKEFAAILHPTTDAAYQARQRKWSETVRDIRAEPFGHGLGTANQLQEQQGRFRTIGNFSIDNSILRVAYEQGVDGAALWLAGLLLLLVGLVRRAAAETDPARAGPAIAATATLVAYAAMLYPSNAFDGFIPLSAWLLVGVGLAPFLVRQHADAPETARLPAIGGRQVPAAA